MNTKTVSFAKICLLMVFVALVLSGCNQLDRGTKGDIVLLTCDGSHHSPHQHPKFHFHEIPVFKKARMRLGSNLDSTIFHSAPYSMLLNDEDPYAFSSEIDKVKTHQVFRVTAWRKDPSKKANLVVSSKGKGNILRAHGDHILEVGEDGWEKIELIFDVTPAVEDITIFAYLNGAKQAYFDDYKIELLEKKKYPIYENVPPINLYISDADIAKIEDEREESYKEGVHFSREDWHKIIFSGDNDVIPVKARLKGDWLDHMKGVKWSFRIKTRKGKTFRRMKSFAIQTPESRSFLHEYLSHQLFFQEGLLTTRYDFSPVYINGENVGIYAIEEQFAKQLVEFNLRREGPIVKFDEDPKWRALALIHGSNKVDVPYAFPEYEVSQILPFERSTILKSPKLMQQFQIAQSLMLQYKYRTTLVEDLFELEKLAKVLALYDVTNGKHGATWHNQRFYYNPISCKLEIINYDNYAGHYGGHEAKPLALDFKQSTFEVANENLFPAFFQSPKLLDRYIYYLEKYSSDQFILDFYQTQKDKIDEFLPLIQAEFPDYFVDEHFLLKNAEIMRSYLPELKEKRKSGYFDQLDLNDNFIYLKERYLPTIIPYYFNAFYYQKEKRAELRIKNFNGQDLKLIGLKDKKGRFVYQFTEKVMIDSYYKFIKRGKVREDTIVSLPFFDKATHLVVQDLVENKKHTVELIPWAKNTDLSPYQQLMASPEAKPEQLFEVRGDTFLLSEGKHTLATKILIPESKTVVFQAGAELDLVNEAAIISHSAFHFRGTENKRILITSSDYSSNGIAVLQASQKSNLTYTTFSNLNTFSYKGWSLSGAVNFYESEVEITHCTFEHNQCEDALNIIRSNFNVDQCQFFDIYADAFDSDFCTGILQNSLFDRVGNDAIDFSTSQISIVNCTIKNIQDKGVSGGEGSTLIVKNTTMEACNIGAASKDLSEVTLDNCSISDCKYGIVVLQKKSEYGPAKIIATESKLNNCDEELLIEVNSSVSFNEKLFKGTREKVAEMFY